MGFLLLSLDHPASPPLRSRATKIRPFTHKALLAYTTLIVTLASIALPRLSAIARTMATSTAQQPEQQLRNVIVAGGSYVGLATAKELMSTLPPTHRVIVIDPRSHFSHLFAFPVSLRPAECESTDRVERVQLRQNRAC